MQYVIGFFKPATVTINTSSSAPVEHLPPRVAQPSSLQVPTMGSHLYWSPQPPHTTSINPHVVVPPGFAIPPKPQVPHSPNQYILTKLKGNIARCNGCASSFEKDASGKNVDSVAVIRRKERDWYLFVFGDRSKCWRIGRSQNHYYHLTEDCLKSRNSNFQISHLTALLNRVEGGWQFPTRWHESYGRG